MKTKHLYNEVHETTLIFSMNTLCRLCSNVIKLEDFFFSREIHHRLSSLQGCNVSPEHLSAPLKRKEKKNFQMFDCSLAYLHQKCFTLNGLLEFKRRHYHLISQLPDQCKLHSQPQKEFIGNQDTTKICSGHILQCKRWTSVKI